ncbi:MAG: hypothetical protein ACOH18_03590 [Candidatus Saccharimonadaceae bacterium]
MNKKYLVLIGILVLVLAIGGILLATQTNKSNPPSTEVKNNDQTQLSLKFSDLQANYPSNPDTCLATATDTNLTIDTTDQSDIENSVAGTIIDIPAGTNVNAYLKTYDKTNATGTAVYESTYGSYNFTAKKTTTSVESNQTSWIVTKFIACKK